MIFLKILGRAGDMKIGISQNQNFETIYTNTYIIMDKIPTNLEIIYIVLRDPILE